MTFEEAADDESCCGDRGFQRKADYVPEVESLDAIDVSGILRMEEHGTLSWTAAAGLVGHRLHSHAPQMFVVTETEAAAIHAIFHERGEFSAAVELRRLFPGITDVEQARECPRTIAGWRPPPKRLRSARLRSRKTG
jgi:hypothetical protein